VQDEPEGTMTNVNVVHSEREKPKRKRRTPEEMRIFKAQQDKEAYERVLQSSSAPSSSTAVTKLRTHRHNTHTHTHTFTLEKSTAVKKCKTTKGHQTTH
jgi:hypothetical protein